MQSEGYGLALTTGEIITSYKCFKETKGAKTTSYKKTLS